MINSDKRKLNASPASKQPRQIIDNNKNNKKKLNLTFSKTITTITTLQDEVQHLDSLSLQLPAEKFAVVVVIVAIIVVYFVVAIILFLLLNYYYYYLL